MKTPERFAHLGPPIVPFHGDEIVTFKGGGVRYVAMRRIVENLKLSWGSQHSKLLEQKSKFACIDIGTHDAIGREQMMLAMPLDKLPLWLAWRAVSVSKSKPQP